MTLPDSEVLKPTATVGIAMMSGGESYKHLIHRADMALYQGKNAGRDRYVIAPNQSAS
ncbi:MAG TPA: diguanylate cyclase [Burkholderiales bacterium]|nr:diguanylate cyclase [Burkholderiales bacterium]